MRIGGGALKGRRVHVPRGIRPTQERVRAAIFNMLQDRVRGAQVLDLFAGTGSLGLEALSRGAARAVFVEQNPRAVRALRANIMKSGLQARAEVITGDVLRAIPALLRRGETFDLVLLDPPYGTDLAQRTVEAIASLGLLRPGGAIVAESGTQEVIRPPEGYEVVRDRTYGDTRVTVLVRSRGGPG
jgi:16S rRNA (guanine966-N2)-methyltransferase